MATVTRSSDIARELLWRLRLIFPAVTIAWADSAYFGGLVWSAKTFLNLTIKVISRPLGVPIAGFGGHPADLEAVLSAAGRALVEPVDEAVDWRRWFAVMELFLLARAQDGPRPAPEVSQAWRRLVAVNGRIRVEAVAAKVGWGRKHLGKRFTAQVGWPCKAVARLIRFRAALCRPLRVAAGGRVSVVGSGGLGRPGPQLEWTSLWSAGWHTRRTAAPDSGASARQDSAAGSRVIRAPHPLQSGPSRRGRDDRKAEQNFDVARSAYVTAITARGESVRMSAPSRVVSVHLSFTCFTVSSTAVGWFDCNPRAEL